MICNIESFMNCRFPSVLSLGLITGDGYIQDLLQSQRLVVQFSL